MSLSVQEAPAQVVMGQRFTIKLKTDQRPTSSSPLTIVRTTTMEDPDENEFDIPVFGPTKVTVDRHGNASFQLWFDGQPSLVEGRRWPIPFKLRNKNKHTLARAKAHVICAADED